MSVPVALCVMGALLGATCDSGRRDHGLPHVAALGVMFLIHYGIGGRSLMVSAICALVVATVIWARAIGPGKSTETLADGLAMSALLALELTRSTGTTTAAAAGIEVHHHDGHHAQMTDAASTAPWWAAALVVALLWVATRLWIAFGRGYHPSPTTSGRVRVVAASMMIAGMVAMVP